MATNLKQYRDIDLGAMSDSKLDKYHTQLIHELTTGQSKEWREKLYTLLEAERELTLREDQ